MLDPNGTPKAKISRQKCSIADTVYIVAELEKLVTRLPDGKCRYNDPEDTDQIVTDRLGRGVTVAWVKNRRVQLFGKLKEHVAPLPPTPEVKEQRDYYAERLGTKITALDSRVHNIENRIKALETTILEAIADLKKAIV